MFAFPVIATFVLEIAGEPHPIFPERLSLEGAVQSILASKGCVTKTLAGTCNAQFAPTVTVSVALPPLVVLSVIVKMPLAGNDPVPPMPFPPLVGFDVQSSRFGT